MTKSIQQQLNEQILITPNTPQQSHQTSTQQSSSVKKLKNKLRTTIRLNNKLIKNEITNEIGRFLKRKQRTIKSNSLTKSSTSKRHIVNKYTDDFDFSANNSDSDISIDYTSTDSTSRTTTTCTTKSSSSTRSSSSSSLSTFNSYFSSSNSFEQDDLDSSLSSVSSCEFEPFEYSTSYPQNSRSSLNLKKYKFDPMSSSSRSNLKIQQATAVQEDQQNQLQPFREDSVLTIAKTMSFDPFTTSSRKSLALSNEVIYKHVANQSCSCSMCASSNGSILTDSCVQCINNQSMSHPIQKFAANICSSTFNSSSIENNHLELQQAYTPQINLSLILNQRVNHNRSLSTSSSCSSLISSSTLNSTSN
jgi:hypothetical protein